ncbi:hypothetical protein KSP40_PGU001407 [Platanthera guangdongensis]|uniref:Uncharacterized protein n=1 Tax=Platanthera guangdongensis TaxID=2320717 RepID=A0ABR2MT01_9ASPA
MASKQHHSPPSGEREPPAKKPKAEHPAPTSDSGRIELNPADCGLDFDIEANGLQGSALHDKGFAYCWSGARANVGIKGGKYCFGCKVISEQAVDMVDTPLDQQHLTRVGISRGDDSVGNLGETAHSFGFGGTGKFSSAGKFLNYGEKFGVGDIIILKKLPWDSALFPHVLLKNVVVQLLFSIGDGLIPIDSYKPWVSAIEDGNAIFGPTFSRPEECEVLMMVGLPASGKTTWAEKWVNEHPEKRYMLLGTNLALDLMKVPGLLRKHNYGQRFELLMDRATGIFNTLLARAAKTPRSYILDQTNVYKSARIRKLKSFVKYRKIAVVIFPMPDDLKSRAAKRFEEMGKEVPADAVNEMLANFILPTSTNMSGSTERFDEVIFPELGRDEAKRYLDEMKRAFPPSSSMKTKKDSPFSCERVVQSPPSALGSNKGPMADFEGHRETSHSNVSFSDYSCPSQAIPVCARPTFSSEYPLGTGATRSRNYEGTGIPYHRDDFDRFVSCDRTPVPFQRSEIDRYGNYERPSSFQRGDIVQHSVYTHSNLYDRSSFERGPSSLGEMSPYQTPRSRDPSARSNFESSSPISRSYGYLPAPSFGGDDAPRQNPRATHFSHHPAMTDPYNPPQTFYGRLVFCYFLCR